MEGGVLEQRGVTVYAGAAALVQRLATPLVGVAVRRDQLLEREDLADAAPELVRDDLELAHQPPVERLVGRERLQAPVRLRPLAPRAVDQRFRLRHGAEGSHSF
jgi:hypothetical protein